MHTFLLKEQSRLEIQFLRDCMGKLILNAYENAYERTFEKVENQQTVANAGGSAGSRTPDHLIKSQMLYQLSYRPTQQYQLLMEILFDQYECESMRKSPNKGV